MVLKGVPALITLDAKDAGPRDLLEQMLSNKCADRELKLLSTQQADVLAILQDPKLPLVKWLAANILLVVLTGQTVDGWAARRTTTLSELSKADASTPYYGPSLGIRLLQLLERTTDNKLVRAASVLGSLIAQPVYLADKYLNQICPERLVDSLGETSFEKHVVRRLKKRGKVPWRNLTDVSFAGLRHEFHTKIFYGGPKSYSYPLHRDLVDGDILCVMHSGCKDVVLLPSRARRRLTRLSGPGFEVLSQYTWAYDLFTDAPIPELEGYQGTVRDGELLYMPGDMLHHLRNSCRHTVTICRRPWRASVARNIFLETLKTVRLAAEDMEDEAEAFDSLVRRFQRRHGANKR